jgi:uncharacterized MAPEG superfamily protein
MTPELKILTWVAALHLVIWLPYILNLILVRGIVDAVGYPEDPKPIAAWAQRLKAAHYNMVENFVVFAALVLTASIAGISSDTTVLACTVYFWARVIHIIVYALGIPWLRTLAFAAGWLATGAILLELL